MNANTSTVSSDCLKFRSLKSDKNVQNIKGYFAVSTAPMSVGGLQDNKDESPNDSLSQEQGINEIAEFLRVTEEDKDKEKELVIMIHGYNTKKEEVEKQYDKSFKYIQYHLTQPLKDKKLFFIGYRWPSENIDDKKYRRFNEAIKAFPLVTPIINFFMKFRFFSLEFVMIILGLFMIFFPWLAIAYIDIVEDPKRVFNMSIMYTIILFIFLSTFVFTIIRNYFMSLALSFLYSLSLIYLSIKSLNLYLNNIDELENVKLLKFLNFRFLFYIYEIYIIFFVSIMVFIFAIYLTFILLRITCYFRDQYRANYFAVPDLVDLIKQLDSKIIEESINGYWDVPQGYWSQETQQKIKRIKLSFIAHSMGAFIATETIRTLADIFDDNLSPNSSSFIGKTFSLGRLILVSPDISIETILPGRSNFLATSLTRCDEAYLFSSQGDTVLRALSTIANYFSFPACTEQRGFRLGNLVINETHQPSHKDSCNERGVIEILNTTKRRLDDEQFIKSLYIVCGGEQISIYNDKRYENPSEYKVAKLFTYFDCTDYQENGKIFLTKQGNKRTSKRRLEVPDHFKQFCNYRKKDDNRIDIHGGYFQGDFSKKMIYGLACLGFVDFLKLISPNGKTIEQKCQTFSNECKRRNIQGLLSERNRKKLEAQT